MVDDDLDRGDSWLAGDTYGELDLAPGSEAAAVAALFRSSPLLLKIPLTPRSETSQRGNSFSGVLTGGMSPHKAAFMNLAARGGSPTRGAAVDQAYDTYSGVIPFKIRPYYGTDVEKPKSTPRASLAKKIIQRPKQSKDYNYEIVLIIEQLKIWLLEVGFLKNYLCVFYLQNIRNLFYQESY